MTGGDEKGEVRTRGRGGGVGEEVRRWDIEMWWEDCKEEKGAFWEFGHGVHDTHSSVLQLYDGKHQKAS